MSRKTSLPTECSKLHRLTLAETDGVPYMIPLAVGYPHMITANIDVMDILVRNSVLH
jgi:hypothetical protein